MTNHTEHANAEQAEIKNSLPAIEGLLDDPLHRDKILDARASEAATALQNYMAISDRRKHDLPDVDIYEITADIFDYLYDPRLPTVGIDVDDAFIGHELIALAAQQRRLRGKPTCNVVLFPSGTDCARLVTTARGEHRLEVSHGILVGPDGKVFAQELPQPVVIDVLEAANVRLLQQCAERNIPTLNHPTLTALHDAKEGLDMFTEHTDVRPPQRVAPKEMWADNPDAQYVIKPTCTSGGIGVRFFCGRDNQSDAFAYFDFLDAQGYAPVIEERVITWPLFNEGVRQDWNVRALVANGELVDLYIRMSKWGNVVNHVLGADTIPIRDLAQYTDRPETATRLTEQLLYHGHALAGNIPTGMAGIDLTIDIHGDPYVYEINTGQTGGLQTIAQLHDDAERKLLGAHVLIEGWLRQFNLQPMPSTDELSGMMYMVHGVDYKSMLQPRREPAVVSERLARTLTQLRRGLLAIGKNEMLADLDESEVQTLSATRFEIHHWLASAYKKPPVGVSGAEQNFDALAERHFHLAPLEFVDRLAEIACDHPYPERLLPFVAICKDMFPHHPKLALAEIVIYSHQTDVKKVYAAMQQAIAYGISRDDAIETATPFCTYSLYKTAGIEPEEIADGKDFLMPIFRAYMKGNYDDALAACREACESAPTKKMAAVAAAAGLQLAIAERDTQAVRDYLQRFVTADNEKYLLITDQLMTVLNAQEVDDAGVLAVQAAMLDMHTEAAGYYLRAALHNPQQALAPLAGIIQRDLGDAYGKDAAEAFMKFLQAFAHETTPSPITLDGPLGLMAEALAAMKFGDSEIMELIDRIQNDPHLRQNEKFTLVERLGFPEPFWLMLESL